MNKKMTKCKTCGAEIAKSAKACPNCGARQHTGAYAACAVIVVITVFLCIFILATSSGNHRPAGGNAGKAGAGETPIAISAQDLYQAYADNAVNADNLYKGKLLAVTGDVSDITEDIIAKDPCVSLSSGDPLGIYPIQCFFSDTDDENAEVARLSDGQTVTIIGKCSGSPVGIVQLTKCHLSE